MAFNIRLTDGTLLTQVEDGTIDDASCSLTLIGKNYVGYGTIYNDNLVHLLENFSNDTAPENPLEGQLWWDKSGNLKVYAGEQSGFQTLNTISTTETRPTSAIIGSSWWDTVNKQLYVYSGTDWVLVGPAISANVGQTGLVTQQIRDTDDELHFVSTMYVGNQVVGIYSRDQEFTPEPVQSGFSSIKPGFNFVSNALINNIGLWGSASQLGGIDYSNYARTDIDITFDANVTVMGNLIANISGNLTSDDATISGNLNAGNIIANSATVSGNLSAGNLSISGNIIGPLGILGNLNTVGNASITGNLTAGNISGIIRPSFGSGEAGIIFPTPSSSGGDLDDLATIKFYSYSGDKSVLEIKVTNDVIHPTYGPDIIKINAIGGTEINNALFTTNITTGVAANVGTITGTWSLTSGSKLNATYADLAEMFASDQKYEPGTVVKIGGEYEVTQEDEPASNNVFGVVSSQPAYIMNAFLPNAVPIALAGKVPVKVIGQIAKGDRLISAGNGLAKAAGIKNGVNEITPFNIIGISLENKSTDDEGIVLAFVNTNK